jgi:hypothetical protein
LNETGSAGFAKRFLAAKGLDWAADLIDIHTAKTS